MSYPAAKTPKLSKHSKFAITNIRENQRTFFIVLRNNLANLGSFAKVSVPVRNYNSLGYET